MTDFTTRCSKPSELERLKEIWKLAFGDEDAYIDRFFEYYYKPENVMTLHADGVLTSAIHSFEMDCIKMADGSSFSAGVTYALGTDPKYLGNDFGMKCMDAALQLQEQLGRDCSIQVPANDTLFDQYHRRIGYCDAFYVREARIPADNIGKAHGLLSPVGAAEYGSLRERALEGLTHVVFDRLGLSYQHQLCEDADGGLYRIELDGALGCATVEQLPDDIIFVKELLIAEEKLKNALALIAEAYPGREYIVRTPSDRGGSLNGAVRRFAMIKFFGERAGQSFPQELNAYFGLAYD